MNPELDSYYHFSSPQRVLDKHVKPIIHHLHNSNINSFHQLQIHLQKMPSDSSPEDLYKTLPVFTRPVSTFQKFYSQREERNIKRSHIDQKKRNSFTLSPSPKLPQSSKERVFIVNPISKVKKHLVQNINLQEMKEALFKKRQTTNRFEQFCEYIQEKDRQPVRHTHEEKAKQRNKLIPSSINTLDTGKSEGFNEHFRITTRKKYWLQSRSTLSGQSSEQILNVKGFVKSLKS